ncbi:MAG TPA: efflux RND transporter periplasmic adaptor subunit [Rhodocyclaceae bacterium]|nr:efflux RND transporter periplasmic adaptor subunit [Rhodocyclaceae bacterium]
MNKRLICSAALILSACSQPVPPPALPTLVKAVTVGSEANAGGREYSGEVRARHETQLGFRLGGKIIARLVDAGATVKAGQILARLDGADTAQQQIQADAQRILAEAELQRYRDLKQKNFISQSALDSKEATFKSAAAQAALAHNQSAYTALTADKDGVIAAVLAEPGQVVAAGQGVMRLAQNGEREVAVNIPEDAIAGLKPGAEAEVTLWADGNRVLKGRLRELAPAADPATRTYPARISLPDANSQMPLGLSATVRFRTAATGIVAIPLTAVFQQGQQTAVWIIGKDEVVTLRPVTIARYGDRDAFVTAGLAVADRIVGAGVHKLHEGEKVRLADVR